jgi:hypothetical protein
MFGLWCEMVKEALERSLRDLAKLRENNPEQLVLGISARYATDDESNNQGAHQVEEMCPQVLDVHMESRHKVRQVPSLLGLSWRRPITNWYFTKRFVETKRQLTKSEWELVDFNPWHVRPVRRRWVKLRNRELCMTLAARRSG